MSQGVKLGSDQGERVKLATGPKEADDTLPHPYPRSNTQSTWGDADDFWKFVTDDKSKQTQQRQTWILGSHLRITKTVGMPSSKYSDRVIVYLNLKISSAYPECLQLTCLLINS